MKLHYKGKYDLNPDSLPHGIHQPGAVKFKEVKDSKTLGIIANAIALIIFILFGAIFYLRVGNAVFSPKFMYVCTLFLIVIFPHEWLHAICFKGDVYLYTNLKQGMLFVLGTETMSKGKFILMCMLPNIVFGFIPFIISILYPPLFILGPFATLAIAAGAGDYYNVYNAITQMPKGSRAYMHKFNTYWYLPCKS